jgi:hypothetical protein
VAVAPGTSLVTQGDNATSYFVIEAADAEVQIDGKVVRTLGAGDALGEIGLLATGTPQRLSSRRPRCGSS